MCLLLEDSGFGMLGREFLSFFLSFVIDLVEDGV